MGVAVWWCGLASRIASVIASCPVNSCYLEVKGIEQGQL